MAPSDGPTTTPPVAETAAEDEGGSGGTAIIILVVIIVLQCALGIAYVYKNPPARAGDEPRAAANPK